MGRGVAFLKLWRFRDAIEGLSEALRLNPRDGLAFYRRGLAYGGVGRHDQAGCDYARARKLDATIGMPIPDPILRVTALPRFRVS